MASPEGRPDTPKGVETNEVICQVVQTLLAKEIRDSSDDDGSVVLVLTVIQRCLVPTGYTLEREGGIFPGHFEYRVNDVVMPLELRKTRPSEDMDAEKGEGQKALCATYSAVLKLIPREIFRYYPFCIQYAEAKLELTSCVREKVGEAADEAEESLVQEVNETEKAAAISPPPPTRQSSLFRMRKITQSVTKLRRLHDNDVFIKSCEREGVTTDVLKQLSTDDLQTKLGMRLGDAVRLRQKIEREEVMQLEEPEDRDGDDSTLNAVTFRPDQIWSYSKFIASYRKDTLGSRNTCHARNP